MAGGRPWRVWSVPNVLGDIALPVVDVPILVADVVVPNNWVHPNVSGGHRRITGAPSVWSARRGFGFGETGGQAHTGYRNAT